MVITVEVVLSQPKNKFYTTPSIRCLARSYLTGGPVLLRFEAPDDDAAADDLDFFLPFLPPPPPPLPLWAGGGGGGGAGRAGETGPAGGLGGGRGGGVEDSGRRSEDMEWRLASEVRLFLAGSGGGGICGDIYLIR